MLAQPLYQDFSDETHSPAMPQTDPEIEAIEHAKLTSFETGYQAGWDDCSAAQEKLATTLSSALAENLQDATFQAQSARSEMLHIVEEIQGAVLSAILPEKVHDILGLRISEIISGFSEQALQREIEIAVHPDSKTAVESLIDISGEYTVRSDAALNPDQAVISFANREVHLDFARLHDEIETAISEFFANQRQEAANE